MQRELSIYILKDKVGNVGYVGSTSVNAKTRYWEHRSRARRNHPAPVYDWIRQVGLDDFTYEVIEIVTEPGGLEQKEAEYIKHYVDNNHPVCNQIARDGRPRSNGERMKKLLSEQKRGKPTWIKGKRGEEAGWTEERRRIASIQMRERQKAKSN